MGLQHWLLFILFAVPAFSAAQTPADPDPGQPDFTSLVQGTFDAETLAEFHRRVSDYAALRSRMEVGLPPLVPTTNADDIENFEQRLAERIRHARGSRRGQVFVDAMEGQMKRVLRVQADRITIQAIMDDSPIEFDVDVNDTYRKKYPIATTPPKLLLLLPELAPDLQYRFVGRHLILYDGRANMIVDEIPYALQCRDCIPKHEEEPDLDSDGGHADGVNAPAR